MQFLLSLRVLFTRYAPGAASILPWAGGLLMLVAAISGAASWAGIRHQLRAMATVSENLSTMAPGKGVVYSPRFRFRLPTGEVVQVTADEFSEEVEFPAGTVVPVLYPSGQPQKATIATIWRIYWLAIVVAVIGVILFDVGFVLRIMLRKRSAV